MLSRVLLKSKNNVFKIAQRSFAGNHKLQKFNFEDPLNFDGLLTDEERMVQETARQYA